MERLLLDACARATVEWGRLMAALGLLARRQQALLSLLIRHAARSRQSTNGARIKARHPSSALKLHPCDVASLLNSPSGKRAHARDRIGIRIRVQLRLVELDVLRSALQSINQQINERAIEVSGSETLQELKTRKYAIEVVLVRVARALVEDACLMAATLVNESAAEELGNSVFSNVTSANSEQPARRRQAGTDTHGATNAVRYSGPFDIGAVVHLVNSLLAAQQQYTGSQQENETR